MLLRFCLFVVAITFAMAGFSQEYLGWNRKPVKRGIKQYAKALKTKTVIKETDSTVTLILRDSTKRPLDLIYHFNSSGKCEGKTLIADCDTCFKLYIKNILKQKRFKWVKINEKKYVSKFSKHLVFDLESNGPYTYHLWRSPMTKEEYGLLVNTK